MSPSEYGNALDSEKSRCGSKPYTEWAYYYNCDKRIFVEGLLDHVPSTVQTWWSTHVNADFYNLRTNSLAAVDLVLGINASGSHSRKRLRARPPEHGAESCTSCQSSRHHLVLIFGQEFSVSPCEEPLVPTEIFPHTYYTSTNISMTNTRNMYCAPSCMVYVADDHVTS